MNEKVSIIVPVYNAEKYLNKCIDSILKQSYTNIELILIDDGSKDSSPKICDDWAKKDNRIKVVHKINGGVSRARNSGLDFATGKYVQFVDSDDWINPTMTEQLINALKQYNVELSICGYNRVNKDGVLINKVYYDKPTVSISLKQDLTKLFFAELLNSPWNKLYLLKLCPRFDNEICLGEDLLFNLDYFNKISDFVNVPNCEYNYFVENTTSLTHKKYDQAFEWHKEIFEKMIYYIDKKEELGVRDIYWAFVRYVKTFIFNEFDMNSYKVSKKRILQMLHDKFVITSLNMCKPKSFRERLKLYAMKRKRVWLLRVFYRFSKQYMR